MIFTNDFTAEKGTVETPFYSFVSDNITFYSFRSMLKKKLSDFYCEYMPKKNQLFSVFFCSSRLSFIYTETVRDYCSVNGCRWILDEVQQAAFYFSSVLMRFRPDGSCYPVTCSGNYRSDILIVYLQRIKNNGIVFAADSYSGTAKTVYFRQHAEPLYDIGCDSLVLRLSSGVLSFPDEV